MESLLLSIACSQPSSPLDVPLLAQRPNRLRAAVVELGRLAGEDGPGAQDEDTLQADALGHLSLRRWRN